jgi:hypothetical protein
VVRTAAAGRAPSPDPLSRSRLTPATLEQVAPLLIAVGAALSIAGIIDAGLYFIPPGFGDATWEFGTIGQLMDTLPAPTMGVLFLAVGLRALGTRRGWTRGMAVVCGVAVAVLAVMAVLFLLDLPVAWRSMTQRGVEQASPLIRAGLERGIVKAFVLLLGYLGCYVVMSVSLWRASRRGA